MFKKIVHILHWSIIKLLRQLGFYNSLLLRKIYWNIRAKDVDNSFGKAQGDYDVLKSIIALLNAKRILDIGCGSGRLFPLYKSLGIKEVLGEDVAQNALHLASVRHNYPNIKLTNLPITDLDFPAYYFDLIISNRVLQHIPQNSAELTIRAICKLGKFAYVNEVSDSDKDEDLKNPCCFKHDYVHLFGIFGFRVESKGLIGKQTWILFKKG